MINQQVTILRHGPAVWTRNGNGDKIKSGPHAALSPKGRKEITANTQQLIERGVVFDRLITSPFTRAFETAEIYRACLSDTNRSLEVDDRLVDIAIPLDLEGGTSDEIRKYRRAHPELDAKVAAKTKEFWSELKGELRRGSPITLGIVSHGTPISALLYQLEHSTARTIPYLDELEQQPTYWLNRSEGITLYLHDGIVVGTERLFDRTTRDEPQIETRSRRTLEKV